MTIDELKQRHKITPGKWDFACDSYGKVQHSKKACVFSAIGKGTEEIRTIAGRISNWEDARLMATAPELLAALKSAYALMPLGTAKRAEWMVRAGEIIAKAEIDA